MNLTELSHVLTKLYNKLGNKYLVDNYITKPFEFEVKVRYGDPYEYHKYYAEVYSIPDMPDDFRYIPEVRKEKKKLSPSVDVKIVEHEFKSMIEYVDPEKKGLIGVNFMNVKK